MVEYGVTVKRPDESVPAFVAVLHHLPGGLATAHRAMQRLRWSKVGGFLVVVVIDHYQSLLLLLPSSIKGDWLYGWAR